MRRLDSGSFTDRIFLDCGLHVHMAEPPPPNSFKAIRTPQGPASQLIAYLLPTPKQLVIEETQFQQPPSIVFR